MPENTGKHHAESSRESDNEIYLVSRRRRLGEFFILVFSGLVFASAFPGINFSVLGWCGLVPLLWIIHRKSSWKAFWGAYIWGFAWAAAAFFWIGEIEYFNEPFRTPVLWVKSFLPVFNGGFFLPWVTAAVLACFPALWALPVPFLYRYLLVPVEVQLGGYESEKSFYETKFSMEMLLIFSLAAWWCVLEWLRTWIFTGLPWNFLGVTQWRNIPLIQICEFTGVYGVSFILAAVNFSLFAAVHGWMKSFSFGRYKRPYPFIFSMVLIMLVVLLGSRLMSGRSTQGRKFTAAVLQGNIAQCRAATEAEAASAMNTYIDLSRMAVHTHPDIVIWPETAVPFPLMGYGDLCSRFRSLLSSLVKESGIPFLIGSVDFNFTEPGQQPDIFNSALLINRQSISSSSFVADRFYKVHIVPFGEFVPLGDYFPWLVDLIGMGRNLTAGSDFEPIQLLPGVRAGINICFEDVFPYVSRYETLRGANLLVVLTNDAWYPESSEPEQHLANSIFRAVENRRPMIRCGNNSCSCLILPNGAVVDAVFVSESADSKGRRKLLLSRRGKGIANFTVDVRENPPLTFYTRYGDVFIWLCFGLFGYAFLIALWNWRLKKMKLQSLFNQGGNAENQKKES